MSLTALAIRTCTVLALWGRTAALDRVYDSELAPLDRLAREEVRAFLTVAIDEASAEKETIGFLSGDDSLLLVIEARAGARVEVPKGGDEAIVMPDTTTGLETSLDFLTRSILCTLAGETTFAGLLRRFVQKVNKSSRVRGGSIETGERYAARQHVFDLEPIAEPPPGQTPGDGSVWADFIAALRAVPLDDASGGSPEFTVYVDLADAIEAALILPLDAPAWQAETMRLGLSASAASLLGFGPVAPSSTTPPVDALGLSGDLAVDPVDAEAAAAVGEA